MIHPRVLFLGDPGAATPWVGIAKKLARACYDLKIASKLYKMGSGVTIRVENIFPLGGTLAGICKVWIEAIQGGYVFIFHPHSDIAPNGWWFPSEETETREVRPDIYYIDESLRSNATYNVKENGRNIFLRDLTLLHGNQTIFKDGNYWSWWHSPAGDGPVVMEYLGFASGANDCIRTPYCYQYEIEEEGEDITLTVLGYNNNPKGPFDQIETDRTVLIPKIYRNGEVFWELDPYTDSRDGIMIGGMYPVSDTRLLIVMIMSLTTAKLYDLKFDTELSLWTYTEIDSFTVPDNFVFTRLYLTMRWPWRFNSDGTRCSTIIENVNKDESDTQYYSYEIWELVISYTEETDSFSSILNKSSSYFVKLKITTINYYRSEYDESWPTYQTFSTTNSSSPYTGYERIPFAITYNKDDEQTIAWLTYISSGAYSQLSETNITARVSSSDYDATATNTASGSGSATLSMEINESSITFLEGSPVSLNILAKKYGYVNPGQLLMDYTFDQAESAKPLPSVGIAHIDINSSRFVAYYAWLYPNDVVDSINVSFYQGGALTQSYPYSSVSNCDRVIKLLDLGGEELLCNSHYERSVSTTGDISYSSIESTYFPPYDGVEQESSTTNELTSYPYFYEANRQFAYGIQASIKKDYIISIDWPERYEVYVDQTLDREVINLSNIGTFDTDVVDTIDGDNVLLFPIGLAKELP